MRISPNTVLFVFQCTLLLKFGMMEFWGQTNMTKAWKGKDETESVDVLDEMAATYRAQRQLAEVETKYYKMALCDPFGVDVP